MQEQDLDRNEPATPYKLEKAREKGQAARSADIVSAAVFTLAAAALYWKGWDGLVALARQAERLLAQAGSAPAPAALWDIVAQTIRAAGLLLTPFVAALMIAAAVANLVQTGPLLSLEPVKPDFERLSPLHGLRRLFSLRTLFDTARAVLKLVLLSLVAWFAIGRLLPRLPALASLPSGAAARALLDAIAGAGLQFAAVLCLVAAVDLAYTRREHGRKMRMSRRELKDENKQREGDPRIRARVRELRRQALRRSMAARHTSRADVLVTNPTHYAVALRYVHGEMTSPQLLAKGAGPLAAGMRRIAARHRIPVVQNPPLARALYREIEVDQHVPPALYGQVARILVWVLAMRQARAAASGGGA